MIVIPFATRPVPTTLRLGMRVPLGYKILLQLTSDVIPESFWELQVGQVIEINTGRRLHLTRVDRERRELCGIVVP